jgi:hypothetical protein
LFDFPFLLGLLLRTVICSLLMIPFIVYMNRNSKRCKTILYCLNAVYSLVILMHLNWITALVLQSWPFSILRELISHSCRFSGFL